MKCVLFLVQILTAGNAPCRFLHFGATRVGGAAEKGSSSLASSKRNDAARAIISWIRRHYAEDVSIERIAEAVRYSPGECSRIFRAVTRSTIFDYLRLWRVMEASRLLRETSLPVSEIAYECGFSSPSHLISSFRKIVGQTPLQYRKSSPAS